MCQHGYESLSIAPIAETVGILVHGDNHFIVRGPEPDRETALALARHWSVIQIGQTTPPALGNWTITVREFRENLSWAVIVEGEGAINPAVSQLLNELVARGVAPRHYGSGRTF
jgi:hypothetical protein